MEMSDEEFMELLDKAVDALPSWVHERMDNVAIVMAKEPTRKQRKENEIGDGETLFGLYEGVPLTERTYDEFRLPDKISIFKDPILAAYHLPEDVATCIENTVWHEVAHHFGMSEEEVEEEEIKRGKTM
jgi:predicted Zn-dependent protease with MMP-like domain